MFTEALRQLSAFTSVRILKLHYCNFSCLPIAGNQSWAGAWLHMSCSYPGLQ